MGVPVPVGEHPAASTIAGPRGPVNYLLWSYSQNRDGLEVLLTEISGVALPLLLAVPTLLLYIFGLDFSTTSTSLKSLSSLSSRV